MSRRRSSRRRRASSEPQKNEPVDLAEEYAYVIEDLQRIGIIAAVLIAGLVALSFII